VRDDLDAHVRRVASPRRFRRRHFHLTRRRRRCAHRAIDPLDFNRLARGELTAPLKCPLRGGMTRRDQQRSGREGEKSAHASLPK
jgi:hypothetical protein